MTVDILRFNWKPSVLRLLLAASVDAGPAAVPTWARRSGVPRNHLLPAVREAERLGALAVETAPEGLRLLVQRVEMWRERPECSAEDFARAWSRAVQQWRLSLVTEMPGLGEALAADQPESGDGNRNPVGSQPESGGICTKVSTLNVQRSSLLGEGSSKALNAERLTGPPESGGGVVRWEEWMPPESEAEALASCRMVFGDTEAERAREMANWGGRWRNRWRAQPEKLRRVLSAVVEERRRGSTPGKSWGAYASDLWGRFS